jgi:iron(III) transport system permease protein
MSISQPRREGSGVAPAQAESLRVGGRRLVLSPVAAIAALSVLVLIGYPLEELFRRSLVQGGRLSLGSYRRLAEGSTATALQHTLTVSLAATLIAAALAVLLALLAQRSDLPGRRVLGVLWLLPLLIPPFVDSLAWLQAYARGGLSDRWWGLTAAWLQGREGIIALLALQGYPLAYLLISALLGSQRSAELEEAARSSGAGQWRALRDVTLPLLAPAILAAGLIVFVNAASDFGVPAVLGIPAGYTVVTTLIYQQLSFSAGPGALADAVALSVLLAILATAALLVIARLSRESGGTPTLVRRGAEAGRIRLGVWRWPLALAGWLFLLASIGLPLLGLLLRALNRGFRLSLAPSDWGMEHINAALSQGGLAALGHSLLLAALAGAAIAVGGAILAAASRRRGRILAAINGLTTLPFALPGSVIAVAAILAWQRWLYGTLWIILLAYISRFAIFGVRAAGAAYATMPEELTEAGRSSGAGSWRVALDIQRPLVQPAMLAGFALVFLLAVHELTISSLLYTPGTETVAVKVLDAQQSGDLAVTAALAVIVTGLALLCALPLALSGRVRRLLSIELSG